MDSILLLVRWELKFGQIIWILINLLIYTKKQFHKLRHIKRFNESFEFIHEKLFIWGFNDCVNEQLKFPPLKNIIPKVSKFIKNLRPTKVEPLPKTPKVKPTSKLTKVEPTTKLPF